MFAWPEFPADRPKVLRDKLVVAWVAYESSDASRGKAQCHMSVRHLEMRFSFSSQSVAEACRKRLLKRQIRKLSGWLEISTPAAGMKGHHYRLGDRAKPMYEQWAQVGETLYGPGGVLEPYRTRAIFRGSGLGPEGCVVLACIERCGPLTQGEALRLLNTFVSESTVRKRLRNLVAEGLVRQTGEKFHVAPRLRTLVEEYQEGYDLNERHVAQHVRILGESLAYQVEVQGGPEITTLKAVLRKLRCFYCGQRPSQEGGTVEHFPPVHWGGSDTTSMLLPACWKCNKSHGPLIKSFSGNVINDTLSRLVVDAQPSEVRAWVADGMLVAASNYAAAMNNRDVAEASRIASSPIISVWAAMRRGPGVITVVNPDTGEVSPTTESDGSPDVKEYLESFTGIANVHTPRPATSRREG